jgi:UDP-glucose 4-epimerase
MRTVSRVVVTGGSGRLGRYIVKELSHTYEVVNADLVPGDRDVEFAKVDVMDLDAVKAVLRGADAVCHLAGLDLDRSETAENYIRVNVLGSWHVLEAASEQSVKKAVMTSSVAALGLSEMRGDWKPMRLPVDEAHECRPFHAYGLSKLLVERIALSFAHATPMKVTCLRPVHVLSEETIAAYLRQIDMPNMRWLFYYVTAHDVARAYALSLADETADYGLFLLSAADTSRPEPTLDWYRERVGAEPATVDQSIYQTNPRAAIFSSRRAWDLLGWEPTSDFLELRAAHESPSMREHEEPQS